MDPTLPSNSQENSDVKPSFRKPAQDAVNRKYRRHTPIGGSDSSSSGGSPKRGNCSPVRSDDRQGKDDRRELERDSNCNWSSRGSDSHRLSDRHSQRTSPDHAKSADYGRHQRHADEEDRAYHRSSRSGGEARSGTNSDRSREIRRSGDKYTRDKSETAGNRSKDKEYRYYDKDFDRVREARDGRRDRRRSPDDYKNDHRSSREEPRAYGKDSTAGRESSSTRLKDTAVSGNKEIDVLKDKRKHDDRENDRLKEKMSRKGEAEVKSKASQKQSTSLKELHYDSEDDNPSSSLRQVKEASGKFTSEPIATSGNQSETAQDLNAAKVAAMKAAELVNRNLAGGTSYLSTDQKKKLLWGNKKNTSTEESGNRWDLQQLFADRERQEKFNKLMGVKGDTVPERKPNEMDAEKKQKLEMDLEKQYTAGLRRRDGRTVGLGL